MVIEKSMFPKGLSEEEVAKLSDEEILELLIKEKRHKLVQREANRMASIRRRKR